ncbi:hypothetical protein B0H13DRAFT_1852560 [Mycena leptocephala]|nr:hypothetical protein B0H13DRAFT_1852560 [Mycena leptocephala]
MSTQSTDLAALTRAQKRKITVAEAEEKARQEQKIFEAEAKASGGRRGKVEANKNAVEVSDKAKKPRKSVSIVESDAEEDVPEPKTKTSLTRRKYAAPPIPIESDSEPAAPAKLPKSKLAGKVKQSAEKAAAVPIAKSFKVADAAKPKVSAKAKLPPAKIIAESASEASSDENEDNASDSDIGDFEDANDEEFLVEVPRVVVSKKAVAVPAYNSEHEDMQMSDASDAGQFFDSDQESIEIDKPKGKSSKIQSDAEDELPDAPPRRAPREDDDIALHEAIANVLKPRKVSAACQKQADLEKPHVRAAPVPKTTHQVKLEERTTFDAPPPRAETTWHPSAQIVYPAPGKKDILLNSQTEELQGVLRHSIGLVKTGLVFEDGYPAIISRAGFARSYLISSAEIIPNAKHIRERLGLDLKYAAILADILLDRINIQRGDTKRTAAGLAPGLFQFAGLSPSKTRELIEKLLKDHRYIFPVDPQTGRLMTKLPFMHPAMSGVIREAVFTRNFKANNMHLFISTSKKHPKQLELPDAMVALVATALYASLMEYRATGEHQTIAFTEGAYEDTYRNHMKTLADTRDYAPNALHNVLHRLFNFVTSTQPEAGSSSTLINLVEVDESD